MLEALGGSITSLVYDLSLEKATDNLADTLDRKQLFNKIEGYIKRYEEDILPGLDIDEHFEFTRVNQYIKNHLFDKVAACFNLPEIYQRESARRDLIEAVYSEAEADTDRKKRAVYYYIQMFLQIVEAHYLEKIDDHEWFLAGKTVEEALTFVKKYLKNTENKIVDAVQYHGSFAEYIDGIKPSPDNTNAFHYRNEILGFRGRESERQVLNEFIQANDALLWMAVTGSGGIGKSKLLYHFVKELKIYPKWKSVWIHPDNYEQIFRYNEWRYPCNLLMVVDYAGIMASEMGKWLKLLEQSRYRPDKMRFVFIEREGKGEENNVPLWYQNLRGSGEQTRCVERLGYKKYNGTPFLQLSALHRNQLEKIVVDYAKIYRKDLSDEQIKWILEKAEEIDRKQGNPRVLIVLFTADAVIQNREYKNWNIQQLINEIIKKYSEHWKKVLCRNDEKIFNALQEMLLFSTVTGSWEPGNKVPELFVNASSILCSLDSSDLEQLICEVNEEKQFEGKLNPLEPDLIGEYYVLDYWTKKKYDRNYLEKVFCELWEYPVYFAQFIDRCIQNYIKQDAFHFLFQNGMERFLPSENNERGILFFSMLLVNLIEKQEKAGAKESVRRLKKLSEKYEGNEEIVLTYAMGLFNLLNKQEEVGAEEKVRRLEELSEKHEGNAEIALAYAKGLFNLSNRQEEAGAEERVRRLEELSEKYKGNTEIALVYANGLVNLTNKQEEAGVEESVKRLEELSEKYEGNEKIALEYGQGLFNLSNKQEEAGAEESVRRLEELSEKYEENEEIALEYGKGLVNLSDKQEEVVAKENVRHLKKLCEKYEGNAEIALAYGYALVNLTNKQEEAGAEESVRCLKKLREKYEGNEEITLVYAQGLVNLTNKQEEAGAEESVRHLKKLSEKYEGNEEIAIVYAQGLVNLTNKQEEAGAKESVRCLEELSEKHEENEEIALEYANGLFNLSNKQDEAEAEESVRRLEELSEKHEGNKEIALEYAKGLFNLTNKQDKAGVEESVRCLEELSEKREENEEIALEYANGLVNLSNKQDEAEAEESVRRLEELSEKYEGNTEIALRYAMGLFNLTNKQDEAGAEDSIGRLKELSEKYEGNEEIAIVYAKKLVNLTYKQDGAGAEKKDING